MDITIMEALSKLGWGDKPSDSLQFFFAASRMKHMRKKCETEHPEWDWCVYYDKYLENIENRGHGFHSDFPQNFSDYQKKLFEIILPSIPSSLDEYIQVAIPGRVKNNKFYDVLEKRYHEKYYQYYCVYLLLCIPDNTQLNDGFEIYRSLEVFKRKPDPLDKESFEKLFCLLNWDEVRDDTGIKAAAKEANEILTSMIVSNSEKCRIMDEIIRHSARLNDKSLNAPPAYLSKILYDDSKILRSVYATTEISKLIKLLPKSLTFMDFLTVLMSADNKSENTAELGFLLPWLKKAWKSENALPVCLVNAMPPFMTAWGLSSCDSVTVPYDTAKRPASESLACKVYDMTELKSIAYAQQQRVLYFARGYKIEEVREHLLALCRENAEVVAVLPDSYKTVTTSLPAYGIDRIAILPEKFFRNSPVRNFVIKLVPTQTEQLLAFDVAMKLIDRRCFLAPECCWASTTLSLADYATNQPLRTLFYQANNKKELAEKRSRPIAYVFSPELTLWYTMRANSGERKNTYTVGLYLCDVPNEKQKARNKYPRGKKIASTQVWTTTVTTDQVEAWIEENGAFRENLRSKAIDQLVLYNKKQISLKSLWYCLCDRLELSETEKKTLSQFARSEQGAALIIGEATEKEIEAAVRRAGADWDEIISLLENLFELGLRRRLIKSHPFTELYAALKMKKKREESIRELAKRNYSAEEERLIWEYFQKNRSEKGAIGMILCFLTGLTPPYVAALTWKDWRKITYTDQHFQLVVNKKLLHNGTTEWQTDEERCRLIPVMDLLSQILADYKKQGQPEADNRIIDLEVGALAAIRKHIREAEKYAGISNDLISVPNSGKEMDLSRYEGSRMKTNFEWHCYSDCGMTDAEVHHLLLCVMPDTLSKNYVDYGHECIQERMAIKLNQWGQRFSEEKATSWKTLPLLKKRITLASHRDLTETYQITAKIREPFTIQVDSDHDFEYRLLVRREEVRNG